jgi:lipopolysaccharide export system permease protein
MKIIYRYIVTYFFRYVVLCLAVLVFIYIVINLFDNLGKYLAKDATVVDIIIYYIYLTPSYIILLIPVAAIMAVFFVFGTMAKNRELIALKTVGLNINRLFVLLLIVGVGIALFTFVFQETVGVWSQTKVFEHKQEKIDKREKRMSSRRRNFFYYGEGNWVYFIRKFDMATGTMEGAILWEITEENTVRTRIDAALGTYKDSTWIFKSATVREFDSLGDETANSYAHYAMPQLLEKPDDFLKRIKPLEEMNVIQIYQFVAKRSRAGENVANEKVELNYRFSYPLITIIVLLIALPISVVLKRGGIAIGLGISIVIAFLYWGLIQSCRAYGVAGLMNPVFAAWFPNIVFGIVGTILILRVRR